MELSPGLKELKFKEKPDAKRNKGSGDLKAKTPPS